MSQVRIHEMLTFAVKHKASDIHLSAGEVPSVRIDGDVRRLDLDVLSQDDARRLAYSIMNEKQKSRFEEDFEVDFSIGLQGAARFRVNVFTHSRGVGLVLRQIPNRVLTLEEVGAPPIFHQIAGYRKGLVLVTGPTGSGKSTSLAAIIDHINKNRAEHILTIEDPIEYLHIDDKSRISQREVGSDTASYQLALRHVVRQSPDVILIGEMRDAESIQVAIAAALTGHLVLTTLHTIDSTQTLQRILNYFPSHLRSQVAMDLSQCLQGIVCQRLVPRADGSGRALVAEIMHCTPPVSRLLRDVRVDELQDLMRASRHPGLVTFNQALLHLFHEGTITFEVGMAYASNSDEFSLSAKGMATGVYGLNASSSVEDVGMDMRGLLHMAIHKEASDLHLTAGRPPIVRVLGELEPVGSMPLSDGDMRTLLFSIMSDRQQTTYELDRELDFALALDDGRRFRVNAYYQKGRMAAALRAIPSAIPDAKSLGLPKSVLDLGAAPQGLLLVVGPTGSGKSTTLACLVDRINQTRKCRIITIEDPVEYSHESQLATVDQRELFADTHSFSAALKFILRQDPDVILVGEMRDFETISAVLTAAETGHLVLATMHSNDAIQAIDRIVDVFQSHQQGQARAQLSSSLLGVVSQRLLPRKGGGLVPAFEMMVANPAIRNLIREAKMHQARGTMETSRRDGMCTMDMALKALYESGQVEYEDAIRYLDNPRAIMKV